jgi:hypothetical protein
MIVKRISKFPEYFIRQDGLVWSTKSDKFLIPYISNKGYNLVTLGAKKKTVHRLLAETFLPNPENKATVNHRNGDRLDNRVENLEWASYSENNYHAWDMDRSRRSAITSEQTKGSGNPHAKLSEKDILAIRSEYVPNMPGYRKRLAEKYGVHPNTIKNICLGRCWKHV